jgi:hypothetical protein
MIDLYNSSWARSPVGAFWGSQNHERTGIIKLQEKTRQGIRE